MIDPISAGNYAVPNKRCISGLHIIMSAQASRASCPRMSVGSAIFRGFLHQSTYVTSVHMLWATVGTSRKLRGRSRPNLAPQLVQNQVIWANRTALLRLLARVRSVIEVSERLGMRSGGAA